MMLGCALNSRALSVNAAKGAKVTIGDINEVVWG